MANEPELGKLIEGDASRDAVHIAICPVVAAEKLAPGQDIGFVEGNRERVEAVIGPALAHRRLGIVDPFLRTLVYPEQRFYMFLMPRTITSLRHEWTHPAFEVSPEVRQQSESETWLREFAERCGFAFDAMLEHAETWLQHGEHETQYGTERARNEFCEVTPEMFWSHWETFTGRKPPNKTDVFYSCSC
jgi:hypothetical protein